MLDCDSSTNATSVRLRSRTALFDHGGVVPVPRTVQLSATQVRVASSRGGAPLTGGAAMLCSARIRPYLDDIEHGTHVPLTPDAYEARVRAVHVDVQQESDGWLLSTRSREQLDIAYEVVDRHTHEVVLRDEAQLTCASGPAQGDAEGAGPQVLVTRDGRLFRGMISHSSKRPGRGPRGRRDEHAHRCLGDPLRRPPRAQDGRRGGQSAERAVRVRTLSSSRSLSSSRAAGTRSRRGMLLFWFPGQPSPFSG